MSVSLKVFMNHRDAPAYLSVVIAVIAAIFSSLSKWWIITPTLLLLVIWLINIWLEHNLNLIIEYKSLMNFLERLSRDNFECKINVLVFLNDQVINKRLSPSQKHYFDTKGNEINIKFNNLNAKIDKCISFRYLLLNRKKTHEIAMEFLDIVNDTEEFYKRFTGLLKTENLSKSFSGFDMVKKSYDAFVSALEQSRFTEIKNEFRTEFFYLLPDPNQ